LLVVFDFDDDITCDVLIALRQNAIYRYCPFFSWDHAPDACQMLLDGPFEERAYKQAEEIQARILSCERHDGKHPERQDSSVFICRYVFARDGMQLLPELTYHNQYGFSYPLVAALTAEGNANEHWYVLNSLVKRGYLESKETINELQMCPGCEGGLLNFKHCCPNCQSVDLSTEPFVHCFTCGNVGPVSEFMKHQELVCHRCQTTLKHIGIDYDKPLEDKICKRCQHRFFEPHTLSICFSCKQVGEPDALKTRKLNAFQLTKKGEQFAKNQLKKLEVDLGAFFELVNFSLLELVIQWQVKVAVRHAEVEFIAGVIYVENIEVLSEEIGFLKTEQQLVLFYENVRELFRTTDLVSVHDDKLFCFLSMTNFEHLKVIQDRIRNFDKNVSETAATLDIKFGFLSSAEIIEGELKDELLINEVLSRVSHD